MVRGPDTHDQTSSRLSFSSWVHLGWQGQLGKGLAPDFQSPQDPSGEHRSYAPGLGRGFSTGGKASLLVNLCRQDNARLDATC